MEVLFIRHERNMETGFHAVTYERLDSGKSPEATAAVSVHSEEIQRIIAKQRGGGGRSRLSRQANSTAEREALKEKLEKRGG